MRIRAALATAALLIGGLTATTAYPASAAGADGAALTAGELLEEPSVLVLDEAEAVAELSRAGFDVASVEEAGGALAVDLGSELGDGSAVDTALSVDLSDGTGSATIASESLPTDETVLAFEIHELTEDLVDVTITDTATGASQRVSSDTGEGAALPLILGIPLVISALEALIVASAAVIIAGVTYVALTKAIEAINRNGSSFQHFMAARVSGKPLMIGNGITFSNAVSRVKAKSDVWSRSQNGAMTVCRSASGGMTLKAAEIDKSGSYKVWHYHTNPKNGAHCFYGAQR
jgi:hypothetical protein